MEKQTPCIFTDEGNVTHLKPVSSLQGKIFEYLVTSHQQEILKIHSLTTQQPCFRDLHMKTFPGFI